MTAALFVAAFLSVVAVACGVPSCLDQADRDRINPAKWRWLKAALWDAWRFEPDADGWV